MKNTNFKILVRKLRIRGQLIFIAHNSNLKDLHSFWTQTGLGKITTMYFEMKDMSTSINIQQR